MRLPEEHPVVAEDADEDERAEKEKRAGDEPQLSRDAENEAPEPASCVSCADDPEDREGIGG